MNLTEKQQAVYAFIRQYMESTDRAPSYDEIRKHFGLQSFQSVQKYLKQLERKGFIRIPGKNQKRAILLVERGGATVTLQMAGVVAAGSPIEPLEQQETVSVSARFWFFPGMRTNPLRSSCLRCFWTDWNEANPKY